MVLPSITVQAQTPSLPGSADPGRLQERLLLPGTQEQAPIIAPEDTELNQSIPSANDGFILNGVTLNGISAFDAQHFDALIGEYSNRNVDINTLNHLAARITKTYRDAGYFLSRAVIPQQEVVDGNIIITVIEGQVGEVILEDPQNLLINDHMNIAANTLDLIGKLSPLHGPTLERYVLLLNDHMGLNIQNILQAPKTPSEAGTVDIVLRISTKNKHAFTTLYNNHGSRFVGPHQLSVTYARSGILNSFDQASLQVSTAIPMSEVQFGAFSYSTPLNEHGLTASLSANYSNSEPGLSLRDLEVEGDSTTLSAGVSYPVIRTRHNNLMVGGAFVLRNSATEFLDQELIDDKTRSLSLFANYDTQDRWNGLTNINFAASKGLDVFGATKTGTQNLSRQQGRSDFFKANLSATRQQELTPSLQIINSVTAQYSPHPLLSSEEFGYGGMSYGRAYDPSEIAGDQGVSTSVEVIYTDVDPIPNLNLKLIPFVFYDIGKVWNKDRGAEPISAASAGFGSYYNFNNTVSGSLQVAFPLTKSVTTPIMNGENGPRVLFSLSKTF